jgi:phosphomannomutase/phosphoglucomutase
MKDVKAELRQLVALAGNRHVDVRLIIAMVVCAGLLIGLPIWLKSADLRARHTAQRTAAEAQQAVEQVTAAAAALRQVLADTQAQALARQALLRPQQLADLQNYLSGQLADIRQVWLFPARLDEFDPVAAGPDGYALLDMLMLAASGVRPPLQLHGILQPPLLVDAIALQDGAAIAGYLAIGVDPDYLLSRFQPDVAARHYLALSQNNGRQASTVLRQFGKAGSGDSFTEKFPVGGTLFRIEIPLVFRAEFLGGSVLLTSLALGLLMLAASAFLFVKSRQWDREHPPGEALAVRPGPALFEDEAAEPPAGGDEPPLPRREAPLPEAAAAALQPDPPRMRLPYDIQERHKEKASEMKAVKLTAGIFRAYDIRGVIGQTLDAGVAVQVGRVLGSLALDKNAGPVVVARDGRLSGPALVQGMIEGITASGCDVLDIGAVPTGVLYYAAHELAAGSGVMITGSHNPPDYNGFKIMLAGETLFGEQISDIYRRITSGEFRSGEGKVEQQDVLPRYRQRIAGDIHLERPLRVVIDCGNGIGGVCAADVLRDIGAEVLPLFDEVDGTFPNHHPDPSDPDNLKDLIDAVRLMDADLGLALDGDADRLGVVTLGGSIIYPDRVMMLLAMDVLDRVPGATIIYDVKCTGHLAKVIEQAGGRPVMYKTGHSLIKARMKEIGAPFAGEMSGHFFFGERWYGVDDGIYAAARLLEILAGAEAPPEAILNALPTSFSTPELKVEMQEGENHAFIEAFQAAAKFDGARVSTIDGVRADFADGWGLVRASNTTPILVVRFDAETEVALERIKNVFRTRMLAIRPDLQLPF